MLSPLSRRSGWAYHSLIHPAVSAFPERVVGSARASSFSRLARRSLALRPAHSRCHRNSWLAFQRLQPLRYLHSCSGCFRLELSPGGALTHWEAPPFHGARHIETEHIVVFVIRRAPVKAGRHLHGRNIDQPRRRTEGHAHPTMQAGIERIDDGLARLVA